MSDRRDLKYVAVAARWMRALGALCLLAADVSAQEPTTRLRLTGTVRDSAGQALRGAEVIGTTLERRETARGASNDSGEWVLEFREMTDEVLVYVTAPGFSPVRQRVDVRSLVAAHGGNASVGAITLRPAPIGQLEAVTVRGRRPVAIGRLGISPLDAPEAGSDARDGQALPRALAVDDEGNLAAGASLVAGVVRTPTGLAVLGSPASETNTTLGGTATVVTAIPRDVRTEVRLSASPFDVARGWFSGGLVEADLLPGGRYRRSRGRVTTLTGGTSFDGIAAFGAPTGLIAGYSSDGELVADRLAYNAGVQLSLSRSPVLDGASARAQRAVGVLNGVVDSVARSLNIGAVEHDATLDAAELSAVMRLGPASPVPSPGRLAPRATWAWTSAAALQRVRGAGSSVFSLASGASESRALALSSALSGGRVVGMNQQTTVNARLGISAQFGEQRGVSSGPTVGVLLPEAGGSAAGTTFFQFGGAPLLDRRSKLGIIDAMVEVKRPLDGRGHHVGSVVFGARGDVADQDPSGASRAVFQFRDLAALSQRTPASAARTAFASHAPVHALGAFVGLADRWQPTARTAMIGGLRLDAIAIGIAPPGGLASDIMALRPDLQRSATRYALSPRFGFTHRFSRPPEEFTQVGTRVLRVPAGAFVRGGAGRFVGLPSVRDMASGAFSPAIENTECIGGGQVELADPSAFFAGCAGRGASTLTRAVGPVAGVSAAWSPTATWRGTVGAGAIGRGIALSTDLILSYTEDVMSVRDGNLASQRSIVLADERRPVFGPPTFDPASGVRPIAVSRVNPAVAAVNVVAAAGSVRTRQLSVTASRVPQASSELLWRFQYALTKAESRTNGFADATAGDPSALEWAPTPFVPTHRATFEATTSWSERVTVGASVILQSGLPFTPVVRGDVNGDGLANDRAFIFGPGSGLLGIGDTLEAFTRSRGAGARCLRRYVGQIAPGAACIGPASLTSNAQVAIRAPFGATLRRSELVVSISNVTGAVASLFGRDGSSLLQPRAVDPVLLNVTGFDSASRQFQYRLNATFGDVASRGGGFVAPWRVAVELQLPLSRPQAQQQVQRWLAPMRRVTAVESRIDSLAARYEANTEDPFEILRQMRDSLLFSGKQERLLADAQKEFRRAIRDEWRRLAAEVVAAPPGDVAHIIALQDSTSHRVDQRAAALLREAVWPSLSAEQRAAMPLPFVQAVESGFPFRRGRVFF